MFSFVKLHKTTASKVPGVRTMTDDKQTVLNNEVNSTHPLTDLMNAKLGKFNRSQS